MLHRLIIIPVLLGMSCSPAQKPMEYDIPDAHWEPLFFKAINEHSDLFHWERLRDSTVPEGGLEIRIWAGFGLTGMENYRITREGKHWRGYYSGRRIRKIKDGFTLKEDWPKKWEKLEQLGILTLPDSSTLPNPLLVFDGTSYVVEINDGNTYRTYCYGNPDRQHWDEADRLLKIMDIINHEFARAAVNDAKAVSR